MSLSARQTQVARLLYTLAVHGGLKPQRAREFVEAAYEESGLDPGINNRAGSGAAGLFQLLSSGYVNRANRMGGVHNARANALAILPDYQRYWQSHPGAAPGQAASAVESSGEGAGFYSKHLGFFNQLGGGSPAAAYPSLAQPGSPQPPVGAAPDRRSQLMAVLQAIQQHRGPEAVVGAVQDAKAPTPARPLPPLPNPRLGQPPNAQPPQARGGQHAAINELFYDPLGGVKNGQPVAAIGGHRDHVHVALSSLQAELAAERHARGMGLHVGEETDADFHNVHAQHSYHNRDFPGTHYREAADISGDPRLMAAFYRWVQSHYGPRQR